MKKRIFIAVNLPDNIKNYIYVYQKEIESSLNLDSPKLSPFRWTKKQNLHITILFLGYILEEKISQVIEIGEKIAKNYPKFSLKLTKICFGPVSNYKNQIPRMIWLLAEHSKQFSGLKKEFQNNLIAEKIIPLKDEKPAIPHITLARIKTFNYRRIEKEVFPEIKREASFVLEVKTIEVMESKLRRQGAEYKILQKLKLKNN